MPRITGRSLLSSISDISGYRAWILRPGHRFDARPTLGLDLTEDEENIARNFLPIEKFYEGSQLENIMWCRMAESRNGPFAGLYIFGENKDDASQDDLRQAVEKLRGHGDDFRQTLCETLLELGACSVLKNISFHGRREKTISAGMLDKINPLYGTARAWHDKMPSGKYLSTRYFFDNLTNQVKNSEDQGFISAAETALNAFVELVPVLAPTIQEMRGLSPVRQSLEPLADDTGLHC